jgi:hypothetical protein
MAKKRKTLPKNFDELITAKDITALKAVFDACEINAYNSGLDKETALHYYNVPDELARWLVAQGADINARDHYERTPLYRQATIGSKSVNVLLELGADIQAKGYDGDTPLHAAAGFHRVDTVKTLVAHKADIHAKNGESKTALAYALGRCQNADIENMADIAEFLLNAGAKITQDMAENIARIGKEFEFHRENFNEEMLAETEEGLARLYKLFNVEPIAKRQMHDGVSEIIVPDGKWDKCEKWIDQFNALWQLLVPGQGPAQTLQGEVLRVSGRIAGEIYDNGGSNWDADFRKMLNALLRYFAMGTALPPAELEESAALAKKIQDDDDAPERLEELAVQWVKANLKPIPLGKPDYKR